MKHLRAFSLLLLLLLSAPQVWAAAENCSTTASPSEKFKQLAHDIEHGVGLPGHYLSRTPVLEKALSSNPEMAKWFADQERLASEGKEYRLKPKDLTDLARTAPRPGDLFENLENGKNLRVGSIVEGVVELHDEKSGEITKVSAKDLATDAKYSTLDLVELAPRFAEEVLPFAFERSHVVERRAGAREKKAVVLGEAEKAWVDGFIDGYERRVQKVSGTDEAVIAPDDNQRYMDRNVTRERTVPSADEAVNGMTKFNEMKWGNSKEGFGNKPLVTALMNKLNEIVLAKIGEHPVLREEFAKFLKEKAALARGEEVPQAERSALSMYSGFGWLNIAYEPGTIGARDPPRVKKVKAELTKLFQDSHEELGKFIESSPVQKMLDGVARTELANPRAMFGSAVGANLGVVEYANRRAAKIRSEDSRELTAPIDADDPAIQKHIADDMARVARLEREVKEIIPDHPRALARLVDTMRKASASTSSREEHVKKVKEGFKLDFGVDLTAAQVEKLTGYYHAHNVFTSEFYTKGREFLSYESDGHGVFGIDFKGKGAEQPAETAKGLRELHGSPAEKIFAMSRRAEQAVTKDMVEARLILLDAHKEVFGAYPPGVDIVTVDGIRTIVVTGDRPGAAFTGDDGVMRKQHAWTDAEYARLLKVTQRLVSESNAAKEGRPHEFRFSDMSHAYGDTGNVIPKNARAKLNSDAEEFEKRLNTQLKMDIPANDNASRVATVEIPKVIRIVPNEKGGGRFEVVLPEGTSKEVREKITASVNKVLGKAEHANDYAGYEYVTEKSSRSLAQALAEGMRSVLGKSDERAPAPIDTKLSIELHELREGDPATDKIGKVPIPPREETADAYEAQIRSYGGKNVPFISPLDPVAFMKYREETWQTSARWEQDAKAGKFGITEAKPTETVVTLESVGVRRGHSDAVMAIVENGKIVDYLRIIGKKDSNVARYESIASHVAETLGSRTVGHVKGVYSVRDEHGEPVLGVRVEVASGEMPGKKFDSSKVDPIEFAQAQMIQFSLGQWDAHGQNFRVTSDGRITFYDHDNILTPKINASQTWQDHEFGTRDIPKHYDAELLAKYKDSAIRKELTKDMSPHERDVFNARSDAMVRNAEAHPEKVIKKKTGDTKETVETKALLSELRKVTINRRGLKPAEATALLERIELAERTPEGAKWKADFKRSRAELNKILAGDAKLIAVAAKVDQAQNRKQLKAAHQELAEAYMKRLQKEGIERSEMKLKCEEGDCVITIHSKKITGDINERHQLIKATRILDPNTGKYTRRDIAIHTGLEGGLHTDETKTVHLAAGRLVRSRTGVETAREAGLAHELGHALDYEQHSGHKRPFVKIHRLSALDHDAYTVPKKFLKFAQETKALQERYPKGKAEKRTREAFDAQMEQYWKLMNSQEILTTYPKQLSGYLEATQIRIDRITKRIGKEIEGGNPLDAKRRAALVNDLANEQDYLVYLHELAAFIEARGKVDLRDYAAEKLAIEDPMQAIEESHPDAPRVETKHADEDFDGALKTFDTLSARTHEVMGKADASMDKISAWNHELNALFDRVMPSDAAERKQVRRLVAKKDGTSEGEKIELAKAMFQVAAELSRGEKSDLGPPLPQGESWAGLKNVEKDGKRYIEARGMLREGATDSERNGSSLLAPPRLREMFHAKVTSVDEIAPHIVEGHVVYPHYTGLNDVFEGLNAERQHLITAYPKRRAVALLEPTSGVAKWRDALDNLRHGKVSFSIDGGDHFHDMWNHIAGYATMHPETFARFQDRAEILYQMQNDPGLRAHPLYESQIKPALEKAIKKLVGYDVDNYTGEITRKIERVASGQGQTAYDAEFAKPIGVDPSHFDTGHRMVSRMIAEMGETGKQVETELLAVMKKAVPEPGHDADATATEIVAWSKWTQVEIGPIETRAGVAVAPSHAVAAEITLDRPLQAPRPLDGGLVADLEGLREGRMPHPEEKDQSFVIGNPHTAEAYAAHLKTFRDKTPPVIASSDVERADAFDQEVKHTDVLWNLKAHEGGFGIKESERGEVLKTLAEVGIVGPAAGSSKEVFAIVNESGKIVSFFKIGHSARYEMVAHTYAKALGIDSVANVRGIYSVPTADGNRVIGVRVDIVEGKSGEKIVNINEIHPQKLARSQMTQFGLGQSDGNSNNFRLGSDGNARFIDHNHILSPHLDPLGSERRPWGTRDIPERYDPEMLATLKDPVVRAKLMHDLEPHTNPWERELIVFRNGTMIPDSLLHPEKVLTAEEIKRGTEKHSQRLLATEAATATAQPVNPVKASNAHEAQAAAAAEYVRAEMVRAITSDGESLEASQARIKKGVDKAFAKNFPDAPVEFKEATHAIAQLAINPEAIASKTHDLVAATHEELRKNAADYQGLPEEKAWSRAVLVTMTHDLYTRHGIDAISVLPKDCCTAAEFSEFLKAGLPIVDASSVDFDSKLLRHHGDFGHLGQAYFFADTIREHMGSADGLKRYYKIMGESGGAEKGGRIWNEVFEGGIGGGGIDSSHKFNAIMEGAIKFPRSREQLRVPAGVSEKAFDDYITRVTRGGASTGEAVKALEETLEQKRKEAEEKGCLVK